MQKTPGKWRFVPCSAVLLPPFGWYFKHSKTNSLLHQNQRNGHTYAWKKQSRQRTSIDWKSLTNPLSFFHSTSSHAQYKQQNHQIHPPPPLQISFLHYKCYVGELLSMICLFRRESWCIFVNHCVRLEFLWPNSGEISRVSLCLSVFSMTTSQSSTLYQIYHWNMKIWRCFCCVCHYWIFLVLNWVLRGKQARK